MKKPKTSQAVAKCLRLRHNPLPILPWKEIFSAVKVGSLIQHRYGTLYEICAKSATYDYVNLFSLNDETYGKLHEDYTLEEGDSVWRLVPPFKLPDTEDFL